MQNDKIIKVIQEVHEQFKARGNFGHSGRPGKVGGSTPGGGLSGGGSADLGEVANAVGAVRRSTGYVLNTSYGRVELSGTGDQYSKGKSIQVMAASDKSPAYVSKRLTGSNDEVANAVKQLQSAKDLKSAASILDGLPGEGKTFRYQTD